MLSLNLVFGRRWWNLSKQVQWHAFCRCIPFRYIKDGNSESGKVVQVLMISSSSGPGLLFPKVHSKCTFFSLLIHFPLRTK